MDEKPEIKESALEYLDKLEAELPKFVLELRAADIHRIGMLADVVEGVEWLLGAVRAIEGIDDNTVDRITDAFGAMEGAIKNLDYTLVADILEYEIQEISAEWHEVLLRNTVKQ